MKFYVHGKNIWNFDKSKTKKKQVYAKEKT